MLWLWHEAMEKKEVTNLISEYTPRAIILTGIPTNHNKRGNSVSSKPNWLIMPQMQAYSTKGWVYREGDDWIFAELAPDELAEFRSYEYGITVPRMRVRLPYDRPYTFWKGIVNGLVNWFAYCTMPETRTLASTRFRIHKITGDEQPKYRHVESDNYETWLWAEEFKFCRELGCKVTVHDGWGWCKWGVPVEWGPPLQFKERIFIYAFVNELTYEAYVGQTANLERRWTEHLRDTKNSGKVALIQSIRAQGREPGLIQLEEVPGEKAQERERYWTSHYKSQGYKIINQDYKSLI